MKLTVKQILDRSIKATCGITEREVTVKSERVASTKTKLRSKGFVIIGTSEPGRTRKVWFIRAGGF